MILESLTLLTAGVFGMIGFIRWSTLAELNLDNYVTKNKYEDK